MHGAVMNSADPLVFFVFAGEQDEIGYQRRERRSRD